MKRVFLSSMLLFVFCFSAIFAASSGSGEDLHGKIQAALESNGVMPRQVPGEAMAKLSNESFSELLRAHGQWPFLGFTTEDITDRIPPALAARGVRYLHRILREVPTGNSAAMQKLEAVGAFRVFRLEYASWVPENHWDAAMAISGGEAVFEYLGPHNLLEVSQSASALPNDELFGQQYNLHNTNPRRRGLDINVLPVWAAGITTLPPNSRLMPVVMDSGAYCAHPDLVIDQVNSKSFVDNDFCYDPIGHGTHVAGIVAAKTNNQLGVAGIVQGAPVTVLKVIKSYRYGIQVSQSMTESGILAAFYHLVPLTTIGRFVVVNFSGGQDRAPMPLILEAIEKTDNLVLVAAAGNYSSERPQFPARYESLVPDKIIAVGALDPTGAPATYSNWGASTASFGRVLSTVPLDWGLYQVKDGTSMASPETEGAILLMFSKLESDGIDILRPEVRPMVLQAVREGGTADPRLVGFTTTGKRLNVAGAFARLDELLAAQQPPEPKPEPDPVVWLPRGGWTKIPMPLAPRERGTR